MFQNGWFPSPSHTFYFVHFKAIVWEGPRVFTRQSVTFMAQKWEQNPGDPFSLVPQCVWFQGLHSPRFRSGTSRDFPDGPMVENPPPKAGDVDSIPGWGTKISHAVGQLISHIATTEPTRSRACAPELENACVPQQRPSAVRRKKSAQLGIRLGLPGHPLPCCHLYTSWAGQSDGGLWHETQLSYSSTCCTAQLHRLQI